MPKALSRSMRSSNNNNNNREKKHPTDTTHTHTHMTIRNTKRSKTPTINNFGKEKKACRDDHGHALDLLGRKASPKCGRSKRAYANYETSDKKK
jgi:hypothetical protein